MMRQRPVSATMRDANPYFSNKKIHPDSIARTDVTDQYWMEPAPWGGMPVMMTGC